MSKFSAFDRMVIYTPRTGWVCDLGGGSALSPRFTVDESRFETAEGTEKPIARRRRLIIPVFDDAKALHLRKVQIESCNVRALLIGLGTNIVWEFDSELNIVPFGGGVDQVSGVNAELATHVFECSIYQNSDLLAGIPWECQDASAEGSTYYLPGPTGFQGNRWEVSSGDSVDEDGTFSGSGAPKLEMYFPLEDLQYTLGGNFIGNIKTLDFSGATLSTTTKSVTGTDVNGTIDAGTWKIQINVTSASSRPTLTVRSAGALHSDRVGGCIDCSDPTAELSTAPSWTS